MASWVQTMGKCLWKSPSKQSAQPSKCHCSWPWIESCEHLFSWKTLKGLARCVVFSLAIQTEVKRCPHSIIHLKISKHFPVVRWIIPFPSPSLLHKKSLKEKQRMEVQSLTYSSLSGEDNHVLLSISPLWTISRC